MLFNETLGYEIKVIDSSYNLVTSANGFYSNLNSGHRIFIKIFDNSSSFSEKTVKKFLKLQFLETNSAIDFHVYKVNVKFNVANMLLYASLDSPTNLIDRKYIKQENYVQTDKLRTVDFDLSSITSASYVIGIKVNTSSGYNLSKYMNVLYSSVWLSGINNACSYQNTSITNYDTSYVELASGDLINKFSLMNTCDDFLPFELNLVHSPYNIVYDFTNLFCLNTYYHLIEDNNGICLINNADNRLFFNHIELSSSDFPSTQAMVAEYYRIYEELGVKRPIGTVNFDFYYCAETGDYSFTYITNSDFKILDQDNNSTELKYLVTSSDKKVYGLKQIKDKNNNIINFSYSNNKISTIQTEEYSISFSYTSGKISSITSSDLNKQVNITYNTSSLVLDYYHNSVLNDSLEIIFDSNSYVTRINNRNISNLSNNISYITFTYTNEVLTAFNKCYGSYLIDKMTFSFTSDYTRVGDFRNNYEYLFFDSYGRLTSVIDENGLCINNKYSLIDSRSNLDSTSNSKLRLIRNLIENNSFEYANGTNLFGWSINSSFSLVDDSLYGGKSLFINSTSNVTLSQTVKVKDGSYYLNLFLKAETYGTVTVNAKLTYTYNGQTIVSNYPISLTNLDNTWKRFTSSQISVGSSYLNPTIEITITLSGTNKIYIDEVNLTKLITNKYNLIENGYLEKTTTDGTLPSGFTITGTNISYDVDTYSGILNKILENKVLYFSPIEPSVVSGALAERSIKKVIDYSGLKGEEFVFSLMIKTNMNYGEDLVPYVKFNHTGYSKTYEISLDDANNNWQVLSKKIITEDAYTSIEIGVTYNGIKEFYLDSLSLERDGLFNNTNYDSNGRVINDSNLNHNAYQDNKIQYQIDEYGNTYKYEFQNELVKKITDMSGNVTEYFYNSDNKITKTKLTTIYNEIIENNYEYTNITYQNRSAYKIKETNPYGNISYLYLDYLKREYKKEEPNGLEIATTYNDREEVSKVAASYNSTELLANTITNSSNHRRIEMASSKGGAYFDPAYDEKNRRTYLVCNGNYIDQYTYHTFNSVYSNVIATKQLGNYSGSVYSYSYNSKTQLIEEQLNNVIKARYDYDISNNLIESFNYSNSKKTYYGYNRKDLLKKINNSSLTFDYKYDKLNNLREDLSKKSSNYILGYNHYDYESKQRSLNGYINKLVSNHEDDVAYLKFGKRGIYGLDFTSTITGNIISSSSDQITYNLDTANLYRNNKKWQEQYKNKKFIYMWIKPSGTISTSQEFMTITKDSSNIFKLSLTTANKLELKLNNSTCITSTQTLNMNSWNFVGVSFKQQSAGIQVILYLNEYYYSNFPSGQTVNGYKELVLKTAGQLSYELGIIGISNSIFTDTEIHDINTIGYKYLNQSTSDYYYSSRSIFSNNSLTNFSFIRFDEISNKKNTYDLEDDYKTTFDNTLKRDVYKIDGNNIYKFEPKLDKTGTISFWFMKPNSTTIDKYLLTVIKNGTTLISAYVSNNKLYFSYGNTTYILTTSLTTSWHHLYISYQQSGLDVALDYSNYRYISNPSGTNDLDNAIYYFGSDGESVVNTLEGYIESIIYSDDYYSNCLELYNQSRPLTISNKIDTIGRIKEKQIINNLKTDLSHTYNYNKFRITKEVLETGEEINYSYDNMGHITGLTGDYTGTISYDKLGRVLSYSNSYLSESFEYNTNNNITKKTVTVGGITDVYDFTYGSENRLTTVKKNNTTINTISYVSSEPFKPSSMYINGTNKTLTFSGNRLTAISGNISYTYNEFGIRTAKTTSYESTSYDLCQDKIIRMYKTVGSDTYTFEFNYDLNNQLIGLKYLNQQYYYVRDILGKILGIIDEDGRYVVKYRYDSFGVPESTNSNNSIVAQHNPFRFMGYYYDEETGFYYLNSRYYNPVIMRFISQDDSSYLDPNSIMDMNLYVYCNNNPVMYCDPSGSFAISIIFYSIALFAASLSILTIIEIQKDVIPEFLNSFASIRYEKTYVKELLNSSPSDTGRYINYVTPNLIEAIKPDPYARPGQKKQGRELKNKARERFKIASKYRNGRKPPKHHTPGRDHKKFLFLLLSRYILDLIDEDFNYE